ncbi:hypothetical protein BZA70DRAFT_279492 [Myxozyma melibiosi]|uniref:Flavin-containing monooxygenase n=1 Tax=Myxozyma melibiosi TaxID=54550 RepID=A0ABR1F611_9ASCO
MVSYVDVPKPAAFPASKVPDTLSAGEVVAISQSFVDRFNSAVESEDPAAFDALFAPDDSFWRDTISFTSDFRSIGKPNIQQAASDRLRVAKAHGAKLSLTPEPTIEKPFEDVSFIQAFFTFSCAIGSAIGIVKLIPGPAEDYVAWILFTTLDGVDGFPEHAGPTRIRGQHNSTKSYDEILSEKTENSDPEVIIVGGGHNGLEIAARLGAMGVKALVIDTYKRVGDNWRLRYKSLSLHDPVYSNHLAYFPFSATWPVFTPSGKLANFLEYYADAMELSVWTETSIVTSDTYFDESKKEWFVTVSRKGVPHTFKVSHLVLATGIGGGHPKFPPPFKGQELFKKDIVHSAHHKDGKDWTGKTALVVGACTSGHDISLDFFNNGADVTMLQRSPTYVMSIENGVPTVNPYRENLDTWTVDLLSESSPKYVGRLFHKRYVPEIKAKDKELLAGLKKAGFQLYDGRDGCGFFINTNTRSGGYYYDTGASPRIISGDIKVKAGEIDHFTEDSVFFKDGSSLKPDVVVFATGYTGFKDTIKDILRDKYANSFKQFWDLDREGELFGTCRDVGIPNLYYVVGPLSGARFNSKIVALQIIAERKGVLGNRYSIEAQESGVLSKLVSV